MDKCRLILPLLLLFQAYYGYSQTTVKGTVTDLSGETIAGVVVKVSDGDRLLTYGITSGSGDFSLDVSSSKDKLDLSFEHLSYKKKVISIGNRSQALKVDLEENVARLKEVTVRAPSIQQRGDTVSYRLSAFIGKEEMPLEDAIKKLPGIQVEDNGGIKYQGRDISNFYIEGLDLLGGKYNLATKNLPSSYVSEVEVLNNHQDIKMKRNFYSDQVALNIRLSAKARLRPVGTAELLAGLGDDFLYQAGAAGMIFTPTFQSIVTGKLGNEKEFALSETTDHFFGNDWKSYASLGLGTISGSRPPLDNSRYVSSQDRLVSVNSIKKINENTTIKANVNYANSRTGYDYYTESQYYTGGQDLSVTETVSPASRVHKPSFDLEYKLNEDRKYRYDKVSFAADITDSDFSTCRDDSPVTQNKRIRTFGIKNDFSWWIKQGDWYWNVSSLIQYTATPTAELLIGSRPDGAGIVQEAGSGTFHTKEQVNTTYEFRRSKLYVPFILQYTFSHLETDLARNRSSNANSIGWNDFVLTFHPRYEYNSPDKRLFFQLNLLTRGVFLRGRNAADNSSIQFDHLWLDPEAYLDYTLSASSSVQLKTNLQHTYGDVLDLLTAPVQNTYRTQTVKSGALAKNKRFSVALRYEFKKPLDFWFVHADISYGRTLHNLLSSQSITADAITASNLLSDHVSHDVVATLSVTKQVQAIHTKFSLSGRYIWQKRQILQQEQAVSYDGRLYEITPRISSRPWNWLELDYQGELSKTVNQYAGRESAFRSQLHALKIAVYPMEKLQLFGQYNDVRKEIAPDTFVRMPLLDAGIQYTRGRAKLSFRVDNLLNTKQYAYTLFSGLDAYSYNYQLRGRACLLSVVLSL